jgi:hypothetical protein
MSVTLDSRRSHPLKSAVIVALLALGFAGPAAAAEATPEVAVAPQYDTTHVYIASADFDAFVNSFTAVFGGKPSKRGSGNVMPVPSNAELQYVWTPAGTLSVFAFQTPIPYPFGFERTGYLVTDMDQAVAAARKSGAELIVAPFKDPIGIDAVIQWPGGVKMQLYWHFTAPSYDALAAIPENRIYISNDRADAFARDFVSFAHGKVVSDRRKADGGEIGKPGESVRRIAIESKFGKALVFATDGHLPYPFGHELTGYEVNDLTATLDKAKAVGVTVLSPIYQTGDRATAVVQFPGGYVAEIHAAKSH